MPKQNPVYASFHSLKSELDKKCPLLVLVTSRSEFQELQQTRGKTPPSRMKIRMRNSEGTVVTDQAINFVNGHNQNLTTLQLQNVRSLLSDKNKDCLLKEAVSIDCLSQLFETKGERIVNLTHDAESCTADGYITSTLSSYVGVQVASATSSIRTGGMCTINKSKDDLLKQICELGFLFFGMLFVRDEWRGVVFLSADDEEFIRSLPNFDVITICLGTEGIRQSKFKENSLASKLSKNLILWDTLTSQLKQDQLMERVLSFLSDPHRQKHTRAELLAMIPQKCAIEFQYIERFRQNIAPDAVRCKSHSFGDLKFQLGDTCVSTELKLASLNGFKYGGVVFRKRAVLKDCVNSASMVTLVVLKSEEATPEQRSSDPNVYECEQF